MTMAEIGVAIKSTAVITGAGVATQVANVLPRIDTSRFQHIFRNTAGHVNPSTTTSQMRFMQLFQNVASNPNNLNSRIVPSQQALDAGAQGFSQVMRNGNQVWVIVRDGVIQNAGVNPSGIIR